MYFYFSGDYPSAVKFNGIYFGMIENSVKACNFDFDNVPLVEIASLNGSEPPKAFLPNGEFLSSPPNYATVTDLKGGYLIRFRKTAYEKEFKVLAQEKFNDLIVTAFNENGLKLSIETPKDFYAENLDLFCENAKIERFTLDGYELLAISFTGETTFLCVYSFKNNIEKLFYASVDEFSIGNELKTTENYKDMAKHKVEINWAFVNGKMIEKSRTVTHSASFDVSKVPARLLPYAFCEEFLCRGEYTEYLTGNVKANADKLGGYLGGFIGVMPPPVFRNEKEVGLIYHTLNNRYSTDYFVFETDEKGKIYNIKKTT